MGDHWPSSEEPPCVDVEEDDEEDDDGEENDGGEDDLAVVGVCTGVVGSADAGHGVC